MFLICKSNFRSPKVYFKHKLPFATTLLLLDQVAWWLVLVYWLYCYSHGSRHKNIILSGAISLTKTSAWLVHNFELLLRQYHKLSWFSKKENLAVGLKLYRIIHISFFLRHFNSYSIKTFLCRIARFVKMLTSLFARL